MGEILGHWAVIAGKFLPRVAIADATAQPSRRNRPSRAARGAVATRTVNVNVTSNGAPPKVSQATIIRDLSPLSIKLTFSADISASIANHKQSFVGNSAGPTRERRPASPRRLTDSRRHRGTLRR